MKRHKFWAWASVVCAIMTMYTGYKHKKAFASVFLRGVSNCPSGGSHSKGGGYRRGAFRLPARR